MLKMHFNIANGIYSVRRVDRSTALATDKRFKVGLLGVTYELAPSVHVIATKGIFELAAEGKRPEVPVVVTKWPLFRLVVARVKEYINE